MGVIEARVAGKTTIDGRDVLLVTMSDVVDNDSAYEIDAMSGATRTGRGVTNLLHFWLGERGYARLSLETGSGPAFEPAHALYRKYGFEFCGPFGDYTNDPFSRFMTRRLAPR